ncbi:hypothetical protein UT300005_04640 [Clostridium sp. CTA-5]
MRQLINNSEYSNEYMDIRFKAYQGGIPSIENNREMIAYAFGYPIEDVDTIYKELDRELQSSVDYINTKYKKEMDDKLKNLEFTFAFIGCSFVSDYQSFFNVVRRVLAPYSGIKLIDASVTGDTTPQTISNIYNRVLRYKPQITAVFIGINDMRQNNDVYSKPNVSQEEYHKNMNYIAKILRHKGSRIIFNTLSGYDTERMEIAVAEKRWTYNVEFDDAYNKIIREVALENGCILNDMDKKFKEFDGPMNIPNNGLHLTYQAQSFFADKFMETFLGML